MAQIFIPGLSSVTLFQADTGGAVMPYGGNFSAVGGFSFLAVTTLAEAVKPKYGGNFTAVDGFSLFGGNDLVEAVKPKHDGIFSALDGFSLFGGNVNGDSKLWLP